MAKLVLATCQFRIEKQVKKNLASILRQMRYAKTKGAKLIHFSEACLCGYLGSDLKSVSMMDWDKVARAMQEIMSEARKLGVWVVLGSNHKLTGRHKPHNSLYVIDHRGRLVNRYDKRYCTDQDLEHYSPGQAWVTFKVSGVTCGLLICHDFRYPELFRQYKKRGVQLMLASFHMAGMKRWWYDHYQDMGAGHAAGGGWKQLLCHQLQQWNAPPGQHEFCRKRRGRSGQ